MELKLPYERNIITRGRIDGRNFDVASVWAQALQCGESRIPTKKGALSTKLEPLLICVDFDLAVRNSACTYGLIWLRRYQSITHKEDEWM